MRRGSCAYFGGGPEVGVLRDCSKHKRRPFFGNQLFETENFVSKRNSLLNQCLCDICAAAPGFNSLISAPSVPLLISPEPVELFCIASNISSTDSFCFVKQKQETVEDFLQFFIYKYAQFLPACAERKFTAIKATTQP